MGHLTCNKDSISDRNRTSFYLDFTWEIVLSNLVVVGRRGQSPGTGQVIVSSAEIQDDVSFFIFFFLVEIIRMFQWKHSCLFVHGYT